MFLFAWFLLFVSTRERVVFYPVRLKRIGRSMVDGCARVATTWQSGLEASGDEERSSRRHVHPK